MPSVCRAEPLARALVCVVLLLCAAGASASAQELPDLYPDAVPSLPPAPSAGPVPDLAPSAGAAPVAGRLESCALGPVARRLPGVDPREPAWSSYVRYTRHGERRSAELMWRLAREPRFRWFGRWTGPNLPNKIRRYLGCAGTLQPGPFR